MKHKLIHNPIHMPTRKPSLSCLKCGAETLGNSILCETCTNSVMDLVRDGNINGKCVVCGEPSGNSLFCSKKCEKKLTVSFQRYVLYRWQWNDVKREYKQDDNSIDLIEKEARSKGITYGELMAQKHNIGRITKEEADRIRKGQKNESNYCNGKCGKRRGNKSDADGEANDQFFSCYL